MKTFLVILFTVTTVYANAFQITTNETRGFMSVGCMLMLSVVLVLLVSAFFLGGAYKGGRNNDNKSSGQNTQTR